MQMITSRQNRLLKFLLPRREYVTLMKIAEYLNVSEKTVQRDLRFLEQWLSEWKMTIDKRSGAGVMLIADNVTDLLQLDQLLSNEGEDSDVTSIMEYESYEETDGEGGSGGDEPASDDA